MQLSQEYIILGAYSIVLTMLWLISLYLIRKLTKHYDQLTRGVEPKSLIKALEAIQKTLSEHERGNLILKKQISSLSEESKSHIQSIILKRFNPFSDTGGDQSFILAMLDGNSDGVVITSLHSRENTRFYVKSIKGGVGIDHPLSPDEQKIIKR